ncbi:hypothetical protein SLS62_008115 [Diatrype stigma]|uniref:Uncharacterized protein n=1 Tax=Diatrype stigma TaxID=117547 RepID=A0AAN9YMX7_9PEZI
MVSYGNKIAFKDQTSFVTQRFSGRDDAPKRRKQQQTSTSPPSQEVASTRPGPVPVPVPVPVASQAGPVARTGTGTGTGTASGSEFPDLFFDDYTTGMFQPGNAAAGTATTMLSPPVIEDSFWQDWHLAEFLRTDGRQFQMFGSSPLQDLGVSESPTETAVLGALDSGLLDSSLIYPRLSPSPLTFTNPINRCFIFPEDGDYYRRLLEGQVKGLSTILPIRDFIVEEGLSAPYLYNAALAISALTLSWTDTQPAIKRHALRHYNVSLAGLRNAFPDGNPKAFQGAGLNELLSWFLARLLLANFDLNWGSLAAWRAHLRAAGRVLSAWHGRFSRSAAGRKLAHAFARMALLVELQNEDRAVTRLRTMNPAVADELSAMLERSDSPRDRLMHLIREVTRLEIRCRSMPGLDTKWVREMVAIEAQLAAWQRSLPASELPVDTGVQDPIAFSASPPPTDYLACIPAPANTANNMSLTHSSNSRNSKSSKSVSSTGTLHITPLTFPSSTDPYTAAVNYAHFLCARMRARTRYLEGTGRVTPPDSEATVLHICRIAAGVAPTGCAQADAFGHGFMPAVVGAYRWTTNPQIQAWIEGWLSGYPTREGIWNVSQTRRLLAWLEAERARRRQTDHGWDIIAARIEEEDDDCEDEYDHGGAGGGSGGGPLGGDSMIESKVWEQVTRRGSNSDESSSGASTSDNRGAVARREQIGASGGGGGGDSGPFKIIVHSKMLGNLTTDYYVVP